MSGTLYIVFDDDFQRTTHYYDLKDKLKSQGVITPSLIWWEKQHGYISHNEAWQKSRD